jgi:hypothetical protein
MARRREAGQAKPFGQTKAPLAKAGGAQELE